MRNLSRKLAYPSWLLSYLYMGGGLGGEEVWRVGVGCGWYGGREGCKMAHGMRNSCRCMVCDMNVFILSIYTALLHQCPPFSTQPWLLVVACLLQELREGGPEESGQGVAV